MQDYLSLKTLKDLKSFIEEKFDEDKNYLYDSSKLIELYNKYLNWLNSNFYLKIEEIDYVMPIKMINEEQSHSKTIINSTKVKQIHLKWNKK